MNKPPEINCQIYTQIENKGVMTIYHRCQNPYTCYVDGKFICEEHKNN